jgi:hypothetical protein
MAKRCPTCKRTYPDKEPECPYCAEAVEVVEDEAPPPRKTGKTTSKKPAPPPDDVADIDVADVVEVVEEPARGPKKPPAGPAKPPAGKPAAPTKLAPKVAQPTKLAKKSPAPTMLAPPGAADDVVEAELAEEPPAKPAAPAKGKPAQEAPEPPAKKPPKFAQPTQLAKKAPAPTMLAPPGAVDEVVEAEEAAQEPPQAKARPPKGAAPKAPVPPGGAEGAEEATLAEGVDLGTPAAAAAGKGHPADKETVDLDAMDLLGGASEVDLGATPSAKGDRPSGLDLIAEAVESGVELGGAKVGDSSKHPVVSKSDEEAAADILADESSAVNLGSSAPAGHSPFHTDQDLDLGPTPAAGSGSGIGRKATAVAEEEVEVSEPVEEEEELVGAGAGKPGKPPKPKYGRRWLGGILIGVLLVGGGAAAAWKLGYLKIPALDGADQANADLKRAQGQATAARADATKAQGDLNKAQGELKKKKQEADELKEELENIKNKGGKSAAMLAKLEKQLKDVKYTDNQTDADKGLQKLIKDFTAAGEHVGKKDDLPEVAGAVKALKDTLAAATKARDDVIDALAKDDLLTREDLRNKDLAQAIKTLGEDRNAAWKALDAVAQGMGKEDPLKKELDGKKFDQAVKALGGDRNEARKALDAAVAKMDENDDPLKAEFKDLALARGVEKLGSDRNDLRSKVTGGLKSREFLTKKKPSAADISAALDQALKLANLAKMAFDWVDNLAAREMERDYFLAREKYIHTPEMMLDVWIRLLDPDSKEGKDPAKQAVEDANYVINGNPLLEKATADIKDKAHYVLGLASRSLRDYQTAVKELKKAGGKPSDDEPAWRKEARRMGEDLTRPAAYAKQYHRLRRGSQLTEPKLQTMLDEVSAALKVSDKGSLRVFRSLVQLDLARKTKERKLWDKLVAAAQKDAAAALKDAPAEAHYALGQVAEAQGKRAEAIKQYNLAIKNHKGKRLDLVRYKNARARVQGNKSLKSSRPPEEEKQEKEEKDARLDAGRIRRLLADVRSNPNPQVRADAAAVLANLILIGCPVAADGEAEPDPELEPDPEAQKAIAAAVDAKKEALQTVRELGDALLKAEEDEAGQEQQDEARQELADAQLELGRACLTLGRKRAANQEWERAMVQYKLGLAILSYDPPARRDPESGLLKRLGVQVLTRTGVAPDDWQVAVADMRDNLLNKHPALTRPKPREDQNALLAMKHYDLGRNLYWAGRFAQAEEEFQKAYSYSTEDARILYFLGLSRLRQRTRTKIGAAKVDFEEAAKIELRNPDTADDVNVALEAIQGKTRKLLNRYRP